MVATTRENEMQNEQKERIGQQRERNKQTENRE